MKQDSSVSIPLQLLAKAYEEVAMNPGYWGDGGHEQYPSFELICEEVITLIVEERTKICENDIDRELKELRNREMLDVEYGFQPSTFGIQTEPEIFNALLLGGYVFVYKREVYNSTTQQVW